MSTYFVIGLSILLLLLGSFAFIIALVDDNWTAYIPGFTALALVFVLITGWNHVVDDRFAKACHDKGGLVLSDHHCIKGNEIHIDQSLYK